MSMTRGFATRRLSLTDFASSWVPLCSPFSLYPRCQVSNCHVNKYRGRPASEVGLWMVEVRTPAGSRVSSRYHIYTISLGPISGCWRSLPLADNNREFGSFTDRSPVHLHRKVLLVQSISERCFSMRTYEWHRRCRITTSLCRDFSRSPRCIQICVNWTYCIPTSEVRMLLVFVSPMVGTDTRTRVD